MLSTIVFIPLAGALLVLLAGGGGDRHDREPLVRWLTLGVSLVTFAATLLLWWRFDAGSADYQFVEQHAWIPAFGIQYLVGVDGISLFLVVLTGFLTPLALLSSWDSVHKNVKLFSFFMLALESAMLGVFVSIDLFLFYIFWDAMLIPMYFLIGIWGVRAAHLRGGEVHPLHDGRQRPDAHRDHRSRLGAQRDRAAHVRPARTLRGDAAVEPREVVLPGLRGGVPDQGAALPVPHVAARRARRGADGRLGHPGRRAC